MKPNLLLFALLVLMLHASKINAQYHITSVTRTDTVAHPYCDTAQFLIRTDITCGICSLFYANVNYGDGQSGIAFDYDTAGNLRASHCYEFPGIYTAKFVLIVDSSGLGGSTYPGPTADDSAITFVNNSSNCYALPIQIFYDALGSGLYHPGDTLINFPVKVEVSKNGVRVDTVSCTSGLYYNTPGVAGDVYSFKLISFPPDMAVSCPSGAVIYDTINSYSSVYPIKYFGLTCTGMTGFDLTVTPVIPITGIRDQLGHIYVSNLFCNPVNATVTLNFSPRYAYTGGCFPIPTSASGHSITWDLTGVNIITQPIDLYYVLWDTAGGLAAGDTVQEHITVTPTTGDLNPLNNYAVVIDTVSAAVDPNEMSVSPSGYISSGTLLRYTINFENTGNDTAFNISVYDTLSDNVDVKSLNVVMASAVMNIAIMNAGGHNIVRFDFPNINLLDSSHHGQCDGAVIFTVKAKDSLPNGTTIFNRAGIYFDYNPVVMTNTVENIIGIPSGTTIINTTSKVSVFPNPASEVLTILVNDAAYSNMTITNTIGQVIMQQQINGKQTKADVSMLPPGIYFITLRGDTGVKVVRVEKI